MSVGDSEDVNIVNEDSTKCNIFISKLINQLKEEIQKAKRKAALLNKETEERLSKGREKDRTQALYRNQVDISDHEAQAPRKTHPNAANVLQSKLQVCKPDHFERLGDEQPHGLHACILSPEVHRRYLPEHHLRVQDQRHGSGKSRITQLKFPVFYYAYQYMISLYSIKKMAESKFKTFIETLIQLQSSYDMNTNSTESFSTKILLFHSFMCLTNKYVLLLTKEGHRLPRILLPAHRQVREPF